MTLGQFDALPPDERDLWIARHERDRGTCRDCGRPIEECSDQERTHYPFRRVCYVTMEQQAADAAYAKLHEKEPYHNGSFTAWSRDRGPEYPYHFRDGVSIGVTGYDIAPHDKFTTERDASPIAPGDDDQAPES